MAAKKVEFTVTTTFTEARMEFYRGVWQLVVWRTNNPAVQVGPKA